MGSLNSEIALLGSIGAGIFLLDLIPCRVACKWPYAVATAFGGCCRTLVAVKSGTLMNELSIADKNVDTAGEPNAACQKFTKSTTESNLSAVPLAVAVDKLLRSTILSQRM